MIGASFAHTARPNRNLSFLVGLIWTTLELDWSRCYGPGGGGYTTMNGLPRSAGAFAIHAALSLVLLQIAGVDGVTVAHAQSNEQARAQQRAAQAQAAQQRAAQQRAAQEQARAAQQRAAQAQAAQQRAAQQRAAQEQARAAQQRAAQAQAAQQRAAQQRAAQEQARAAQQRAAQAQAAQQRAAQQRAAQEQARAAQQRAAQERARSAQQGANEEQARQQQRQVREQQRAAQERARSAQQGANEEQARQQQRQLREQQRAAQEQARSAQQRALGEQVPQQQRQVREQQRAAKERARAAEQRRRPSAQIGQTAQPGPDRTGPGTGQERQRGLEARGRGEEAPSQRLREVQRQRQERRQADRVVIREPDRRSIIRDDQRTFIRHDDNQRLARSVRAGQTARHGDGTAMSFTSRKGGRVFSEVDKDGRALRRYRRTRDGRDIVFFDDRPFYSAGLIGLGTFFVDLPPPVYELPPERYVIDYSTASEDELYDALAAPPIEPLSRSYALEEIRQCYQLRERMRRIELVDINFEAGSWEIAPDQYTKLERLARAINHILQEHPGEVFLIEGHADVLDSDIDNLTLSDRRA